MLATIEQPLSLLPEPAVLKATLIYHPEAAPGSQFTWVTDTDTGQPFPFVSEPGATLVVTLEGAVFSTNPVTPISRSSNFTFGTPVNGQISIQISDPPTHYLNPLALSFNVDANGVNGINSPVLFLVFPPSSPNSTSVHLHYSSDGSFVLDGMLVLANLDVLTNTMPSFNMEFHLSSDIPGVKFDPDTPILGPSWLTPNLQPGNTVLKLMIPSDAGRFASFQFVLSVPSDGGTVQVTSPDPILINATIGDG
jgi:hypothetical protein